eukprot:gene1346-2596_t
MKSLNTTEGPNRFRFSRKSDRIKKIDIDVIHRVRTKKTFDVCHSTAPETGDKGCFFQDELERCREHDSSTIFRRFYYEIFPLVQSLAELLYHLPQLIDKLDNKIHTVPLNELTSYLHLISVLSRDTEEEFGPFFHRIFSSISQLSTNNSNQLTPEIAEEIFECLSYLLKYHSVVLVENPDSLRQYYGQLLGHSTNYIRDLAAKSFSVILRKLPIKTYRIHIKKVIQILSTNCEKILEKNQISNNNNYNNNKTYYINPIEYERNNEENIQISTLPKRLSEIISGISLLLFYSCKGVKGCLHSKGGQKLQILLNLLLPLPPSISSTMKEFLENISKIPISIPKSIKKNSKSKKLSKNNNNTPDSSIIPEDSLSNLIAVSSLPDDVQIELQNITTKKIAYVFACGQLLHGLFQKLIRYQHPSNLTETSIRLVNCIEQLTECLDFIVRIQFVNDISDNKNNNNSNNTTTTNINTNTTPTATATNTMLLLPLDAIGVSVSHIVELIIFFLHHSNGRALSDAAVKKEISEQIVHSCLDFCSRSIILLNNKKQQQQLQLQKLQLQSSHPIVDNEYALQRVIILFCQIWKSFPKNIYLLHNINDLLSIVLYKNNSSSTFTNTITNNNNNNNNNSNNSNNISSTTSTSCSSLSLRTLSKELFNTLSPKDVRTHLVKPFLKCLHSMIASSSTGSSSSTISTSNDSNIQIQEWLDILVNTFYVLKDVRNDLNNKPNNNHNHSTTTTTGRSCEEELSAITSRCLNILNDTLLPQSTSPSDDVCSRETVLLASMALLWLLKTKNIPPLKESHLKQCDTLFSHMTGLFKDSIGYVTRFGRPFISYLIIITMSMTSILPEVGRSVLCMKYPFITNISSMAVNSLITVLVNHPLSISCLWALLNVLETNDNNNNNNTQHVHNNEHNKDEEEGVGCASAKSTLLSHKDTLLNNVIIESSTSPAVHSEREFARHMCRLEVLGRGGRLSAVYAKLICSFALGIINVKFKPFWEPSVLVLVAFVGHDCGDMVWPMILRSIKVLGCKEVVFPVPTGVDNDNHNAMTSDNNQKPTASVQEIIVHDNGDIPIGKTTIHSCLFYFAHTITDKREHVAADARTDSETVYVTIWDILKRCPDLTLKRSKVVVPLFLGFLRYQYYAVFENNPELPDLHRVGLFRLTDTDINSKPSSDVIFSPKILQKRLEMFLKVFAAISGPKSLYQHPLLYAIYNILLCKPDISISKLALDCIFTFKNENIMPYVDNLRHMIDDASLRNELAIFDVTEKSTLLQPCHREEFIPLLVRILYGRFASRARSSKAARDQSIARRGAILSFISTLNPAELGHFLHLMLRNLVPRQKLLAITDIQTGDELKYNCLTNISSHWYMSVVKIALSMTPEDMEDSVVSWDTQLGYLHLLEQIIRLIGFGFTSHVNVLTHLVLVMLTHAQKKRESCVMSGSVVGIDVDVVDDEVDALLDEKLSMTHTGIVTTTTTTTTTTDISATTASDDKQIHAQSGKIRTMCLLRLAELADQYYAVFDFLVLAGDIWSPLHTLLEALPNSLVSTSRAPALLKLIHSFVQHPQTMELVVCHDYVVQQAIRSIASKCEPNVTKMVMDIVVELLEWNGGAVVLPLSELVIESFCRRLGGSDFDMTRTLKISEISIVPSGSVKLELHLLCKISNDFFTRENLSISAQAVTNLSTLLLGMLRAYTSSRKIRVEELWVLDILKTYRSLLRRLEDVIPHIPFISKLFGPATHAQSLFNLPTVRMELVAIYSGLSTHPSSNGIISPSANALCDITAMDTKIIDGRDFDRCMPVFQTLSGEASLSSLWSSILGPKVCETPRAASVCTAVVYECMRCMYDGELVIRSAALATLKVLVTEAYNWAVEADSMQLHNDVTYVYNASQPSWLDVLKSVVIPLTHHGLKQSTDIIKRGFVMLIAHIIRTIGNHPVYDTRNVFYGDLRILLNIDAEQDFFENITHIQLHRRVRALHKLKNILLSNSSFNNNTTTNSSIISDNNRNTTLFNGSTSLMNVLLPLAYHPLFSNEFEKKDNQNLLQETASLLGAISYHLQWSHYLGMIRTILRRLEKENQEKEKLLLTSLCAVLEAFHFDLNVPAPSNETEDVVVMENKNIDENMSEMEINNDNDEDEDDNDYDGIDGDVDGPLESSQNDEKVSLLGLSSDIQAQHNAHRQSQTIAKAVTGSILPWVRQFLVKQERDHNGNKSTVVRTQVALALTKLIKRLQPPIVSEQQKLDLFTNLVITVIGTMKSRDVSARDTARDSLSKMVATVGMEFLQPVLHELSHNLTEGYQRHVRNYSIRHILGVVLEGYSPPKDAISIPIQANINLSTFDVIIPTFDHCIPSIMSIVLDDIVGIAQEDREVEGASRTLIREAKGSKANEILELCSRCILFRPTYALKAPDTPDTVSSIHALASPLLSALKGCEEKSIIGRVGEALQRVALGLSKNESLTALELLLYLHATLQPFVTTIIRNHKHNREIRGKLFSKKTTKKSNSSSNNSMDINDEDDEILAADLPSYFRGDESDEEELALYSTKRLKTNDDGISTSKPITWLPSDRRFNDGQRAAVEEREREKRERIEVQDGFSAPKLTGFNRHSKAISTTGTGTMNANTDSMTSTDPATLTAVRFCLSLLNSSIRQNRLNNEDPTTRTMAAPFLPLLAQCLKLSGAASVVALAMRCLCSFLGWGLYVKPDFSRVVGKQMMSLMCRGGALMSTESELVQACMKGLTALYQLYNQDVMALKSAKTQEHSVDADQSLSRSKTHTSTPGRSDTVGAVVIPTPLNEEGLRALLSLLMSSITEIESTYQNAAFQLIKVIVDSKVLVPEIYDLMTKLTHQIVQSHRKNVRESCAGVVVAFLLNYPLGDKRFGGHMRQLINNCAFDYEEGREAALEMMATVVRLLPLPVLDDYAQSIFLPLTLRVVNDNSSICRKKAGDVILGLIRRVSIDITVQCQEYVTRWLSDGNNTSSTNNRTTEDNKVTNDSTQKKPLIRTGAQIAGLLVSGRPDLFKKNNNVPIFVNFIYKHLSVLVGSDPYIHNVSPEVSREYLAKSLEKDEEECVGGTDSWVVIYHLLMLLEKFFLHLPGATDMAVTHPPSNDSSNSSNTGNTASSSLMDIVQEALVYPHAWIRCVACRIIRLYLSRRNAVTLRLTTSNDGGVEILTQPNGMYHLARRLCIVLNQSQLAKPLLDAVIDCLVFVIQAMHRRPDLALRPIREGTTVENDTDEMTATTMTSTAVDAVPDTEPAVISGENWVMQRLRGLAVDRRGRRRLYVLKVFTALVGIETEEFVKNHLKQFIEACLRAYNMSHGPDEELEKETKETANSLLDLIEKKVGASAYLGAFREVQQYLKKNKLDNKQKLANEAITNPKSFAERKIARTMKKKEGKKRKSLRDSAMRGLKKRRGPGAMAFTDSNEENINKKISDHVAVADTGNPKSTSMRTTNF